MELSVQDAAMTAIWRLHEAALDRATLIYTFTRSTSEDTPTGYTIYSRQLPMLIDLVHEFCFYARRAIERTEKYRPGIIANLRVLNLHAGKPELSLSKWDHPSSIALTQESFWWVLGRIIHSKETQIIYRTVDVVITNQSSGRHHTISQPIAFEFSSDYDNDLICHYIELESFVALYINSISHQIEQVIQTRNSPLKSISDV